MTGKELLRLLQKNGWKILRINGSHYRLGKNKLRTTVPIHGNKDIGRGLLKAILKQTGVNIL